METIVSGKRLVPFIQMSDDDRCILRDSPIICSNKVLVTLPGFNQSIKNTHETFCFNIRHNMVHVSRNSTNFCEQIRIMTATDWDEIGNRHYRKREIYSELRWTDESGNELNLNDHVVVGTHSVSISDVPFFFRSKMTNDHCR